MEKAKLLGNLVEGLENEGILQEPRIRILRTLQAKMVLDLSWQSVGSCFEVEQHYLLHEGFIKLGKECPEEFKKVVRNFLNFSRRKRIPERCKSLFYGRYVKPPFQALSDALIFWKVALNCHRNSKGACSGKCNPFATHERLKDSISWFEHLNSDAGLVLYYYFKKFWSYIPKSPAYMKDYNQDIQAFWSFVEPIWDTYLRNDLDFLKPYRYDRED